MEQNPTTGRTSRLSHQLATVSFTVDNTTDKPQKVKLLDPWAIMLGDFCPKGCKINMHQSNYFQFVQYLLDHRMHVMGAKIMTSDEEYLKNPIKLSYTTFDGVYKLQNYIPIEESEQRVMGPRNIKNQIDDPNFEFYTGLSSSMEISLSPFQSMEIIMTVASTMTELGNNHFKPYLENKISEFYQNEKINKFYSVHQGNVSPYVIFGHRETKDANPDEIHMSWWSHGISQPLQPKLSILSDSFISLACCQQVFKRLSKLEKPHEMTLDEFVQILEDCGFEKVNQ